jgi:hypothetical protein
MERDDSSADEGLIVDDDELAVKPKRRLAKAKPDRRVPSDEEEGPDAAGKVAPDDQEYDAEAERQAEDEEADHAIDNDDDNHEERRPVERGSNVAKSGGKKLRKGEIEPSVVAVGVKSIGRMRGAHQRNELCCGV